MPRDKAKIVTISVFYSNECHKLLDIIPDCYCITQQLVYAYYLTQIRSFINRTVCMCLSSPSRVLMSEGPHLLQPLLLSSTTPRPQASHNATLFYVQWITERSELYYSAPPLATPFRPGQPKPGSRGNSATHSEAVHPASPKQASGALFTSTL